MTIAPSQSKRLNEGVWSRRRHPEAKREFGATTALVKTKAAPATVSGELLFNQPLPELSRGEGEQRHRPASQETCQARNETPAVGCGGSGGLK